MLNTKTDTFPSFSGDISVRILPNDGSAGSPELKLADAELQFHQGILAGMRLIGFSLWQRRGAPGIVNVTFPARAYTVNGERRSFALLRPTEDATSQESIRAAIVEAWDMYQGNAAPGHVDVLNAAPVRDEFKTGPQPSDLADHARRTVETTPCASLPGFSF